MPLSTQKQQTTPTDSRQRILDAAFTVFTHHGYAQASTLEIASIAKVSKRDLYALVGKKDDLLLACISERASRLKWPENIPSPQDRHALSAALEKFGFLLLKEVTDPSVIAVFRLAIAEAERAPGIARMLEAVGRAIPREALKTLFTHAKSSGFVKGDVAEMTRQFLALLWGDLMLGLLLRVVERPDEQALKHQARQASQSFMLLNRLGKHLQGIYGLP